MPSEPDPRASRGHELEGRFDEAEEADVKLPPARPTSRVLWDLEEVAALPEGSVITWEESRWDPDRRAAVICDADDHEKYIRHTRHDYWDSSIDLIEFPALAFVWPEKPDAGPPSGAATLPRPD